VDDNKILREVRAYTGPKKSTRVYLDDGSEGLEARLKPGYDEMVALLLEKGYVKGADLKYFYDLGAGHDERAWAKRLWRPLEFMFGRWVPFFHTTPSAMLCLEINRENVQLIPVI